MLQEKFNLPAGLFESVKKVLDESTEYQNKVKAHMAKKGIKSLGELSPEEKKKFFNELDAAHKAKNEEVKVKEKEMEDDEEEDEEEDDDEEEMKKNGKKKEEMEEAIIKGKGYDKPENERKAPEGNVPMTSMMPGHDERAAKFLARQAKGKLVKGKAQSAPQKEEVELEESSSLSPAMIAKLKTEYGKISTIDPSGDAYKKLIAMLDRLNKKDLQTLADAGIKFVSGLARNRVNRMKNEEAEGVVEGSLEEYGDTKQGQKMLDKVHRRAANRVTSKQADKDPAYARRAQQTQDRAWDRMKDKDVAEGKTVKESKAKPDYIDLDEAKKPVSKDDVTKLLIKYGNNPESAKKMVEKEFASAVKRHPEATASKIADVIRTVAEDLDLQEISDKTLRSYFSKAVDDLSKRNIKKNTGHGDEKNDKKIADRKRGLSRASGKIADKMDEENNIPEYKTGGAPLAKKFEKAMSKMGVSAKVKMRTVNNISVNEAKMDKVTKAVKKMKEQEEPNNKQNLKSGDAFSGKKEPIEISPEVDNKK